MSIKEFFGSSEEKISLETIINIRWIAIFGQIFAICFVYYYLKFNFEVLWCGALVIVSVVINSYLEFKKSKIGELNNLSATFNIFYDLVQLALLLFLTGGLTNPFSILIIVPTTIATTFLSRNSSFFIAGVSIILCSVLALFNFPLPGPDGETLKTPKYYLLGMWLSTTVGIIFLGNYAYQLARSNRKRSKALEGLEKTLSNEQTLSSVGSLAAAAVHELGTPLATISLVSGELKKQLSEKKEFKEDIDLLISQADRCRLILKNIGTDPKQEDDFLQRVSLKNLLNEIVFSNERKHDKKIIIIDKLEHEPLKINKQIEITYALRSLIDNSIKFSKSEIKIFIEKNNNDLSIIITDDGPGFDDEILKKIGEPYIKSVSVDKTKLGLGLGLFISKNLLERTKAKIIFENKKNGLGAVVKIIWRYEDLIN